MSAGFETVLGEFAEYLALEKGRSAHTQRAYLGDLRSLFDFLEANAPRPELSALTLPLLRSWLAAQAARGPRAPPWAGAPRRSRPSPPGRPGRGPLATDPAARLQTPKARRTLPAVLRRDQAIDAMAAAKSGAQQGDPIALRDRLMVELLYATGIRVSELCGLDVDDVDADRRLARVLGKGNRERTVPFGEPAAAALGAWLADGRPAIATRESGPALLLGARGRRIDPRQVRTVVHDTVGAVPGAPTWVRTGCGTARPPICWRAAPTCASCRSCSGIRRWRPPSSTPMSAWRACARSTIRRTRGPDSRPAA